MCKHGKAGQVLGNIAADASISAGSTALKGGDVTLTGVAIDVVAGQKLNAKSANRLQRIANKPGARNAQVNRANAAQQAVQMLQSKPGGSKCCWF